jgi:hypothetical protein
MIIANRLDFPGKLKDKLQRASGINDFLLFGH